MGHQYGFGVPVAVMFTVCVELCHVGYAVRLFIGGCMSLL